MSGFEVFVDDNFHYMDAEARYSLGSFASYEEALAKAKAIVDEYLEQNHSPGMTSNELYEGYIGFGEDPFIVPSGETHFSAWEYARERCFELCRDEDAVSSVLRFPDWPPALKGFCGVLLACLGRKEPGVNERHALEAFRAAIDRYPDSMPGEKSWYWVRLERERTSYTVYLYPDRFELHADSALPDKVLLVVRFRGSGRRDTRLGDVDAAFEGMRQAANSPDFTLKARGTRSA